MRYNTFTIQNFRGIEQLTIDDLKMVNLLVGRNNCGKTSVLEAFFLLSGMSNPQLPVNIHVFRDLIFSSDEDFSYMFKDLDFSIPISISGNLDEKKRKLTINPLYAKYSTNNNIKQKQILPPQDTLPVSTSIVRIVEGLDLQFQSDLNRQFNARISLKEKETRIKGKYKENLRCSFINPKTIMNQIDRRMEKLLVQKELDHVISVLKEIEPQVSDIRMGAGGMIYIDVGKKKLLPINIVGDGMRRLLSILATIADMKNGIVLIDEIENGFHYSSLAVVWKALFKACREYNVQLVATTHSYECIEACSKCYKVFEPDGDDLRLYRIDRKGKKHEVHSYSAEVLETGIEKDFEVR